MWKKAKFNDFPKFNADDEVTINFKLDQLIEFVKSSYHVMEMSEEGENIDSEEKIFMNCMRILKDNYWIPPEKYENKEREIMKKYGMPNNK